MLLLIGLAVWWGWIPLVFAIGWGLSNWWFPGMGGWHQFWNLGLNSTLFHHTSIFWLYVIIGAIGSLVIVGLTAADADDDFTEPLAWVTGVLAVITLVVGGVQFTRAIWDDDKDVARYYASANIFVIPDPTHPPSALAKLDTGHNPQGSGDCTLTGPSGDDVHACIQAADYPTSGWEPRVSSLDGATKVIQRTAGNIAGVSLDSNSMAYLNAENGAKPQWSGVLDGSGRSNPMEGVAEWDGTENKPTICKFSDAGGIDRAMHGSRGNSLTNLLPDKFPALQFQWSDYWGYCDSSNHPVVVFPVERQMAWKSRLVNAPAGVVVLTSDGHGGVNLDYRSSVKPGELPGPVYPSHVVDKQIAATEWAGGRRVMENQRFGFEASSSTAQENNPNDYLLESVSDHRLYWVTPLTPRYSSSQLFVAYAVTPADQVSANHLNTTRIYVVADDDPRQVNVDTMEATVRQYISQTAPGFFSGGGSLLEFIPQGGAEFRAYGEQNGRVVYRIDVDGARQVVTSLVALNGSGSDSAASQVTPPVSGGSTPPVTPTGPLDCNAPTSRAQVSQCLSKLATQLATMTR